MHKIILLIIICSILFNNPAIVLASGNMNIIIIKKTGNNKLEICWKKVSDQDGYRVYRASEYNGTYTLVKDTKDDKFIDNVSIGNGYYYKIKSYKKEDGKVILSHFSLIKRGGINANGVPASIPATKIGSLKINGKQIIIVSVDKANNTTANVSFYSKDKNGQWILEFSTIGYIGKNGIGKTKEGDNKTPIGLFNFTAAFGVASKPGNAKVPYVKVNETHWLVSDSNSKYYNRFVSTSKSKDGYSQTQEVVKDWDSSYGEQLYNYPKAYKYSLILNYNPGNVPHKGSAIFLHCYANNKYTAGCVAIPESKMKYLLQKLDVNSQNKIAASIIIDTTDNILSY